MKSSKAPLASEAAKLLLMQIKNILQTLDLKPGNSHFGNHKVLLHRMTEIVTMDATTSLSTLLKNQTLEAANKEVVSSSSIKVHNNIKVKVADKNNMPPLNTSNQHLTLETTTISRMLATLPTEKSCSLLSKIGTKDSRVTLTTAVAEVDKVVVIGAKTTKVVVMAAVVEAEVAVVAKAINIIMIESSHPILKTTKRAKSRQIKSLHRKRHVWKHQMLTRP